MRILTWNVNVLRTCLDYHPFSGLPKKNVEGLLDHLDAEIMCFQEHKTPRAKLEKSMACPGPYDGFWTFPRSKTGYSGVCTYVDSRYCVPFKAEEGITGILLGDRLSTMKPPWTEEERIGSYPDVDSMRWDPEADGGEFDVKKLDMEGRAVVCDFGLFVLFNLYCPNETNDTRRPYKMNFHYALHERVRLLQAAGRQVIIVGDINIVRAPADSGEGPVRSSAAQHYEHPARRMLDDWCAPKGEMVDVVRESWPRRDDMFTCWNTKLDARSSNYGSRIDYILCTPGLRPWIKGGDILPKVYGSDHCPVYIDLHESITLPSGETLHLRDQLNPPDRPPSTAPVYPNAVRREAPEPPRFATKFLDEFSGKQTTLKSFFGGGGAKKVVERGQGKEKSSALPKTSASPAPPPAPSPLASAPVGGDTPAPPVPKSVPVLTPAGEEPMSAPLSLAKSAFSSLDSPTPVLPSAEPGDKSASQAGKASTTATTAPASSKAKGKAKATSGPIDMTFSDSDEEPVSTSASKPKATTKPAKGGSNARGESESSQAKLSSFFSQPSNNAKRKSPPISSSSSKSKARRQSLSQTPSKTPAPSVSQSSTTQLKESGLSEEEQNLISQALATSEAEREAKIATAAPRWDQLFAKKVAPLCSVHQKPCKDFIVGKPGPNKGKRFWLCSLPVGAGYDMGRSKRARVDVNPKFRCDLYVSISTGALDRRV
ncbi:exodeoxyribonuclease III [Cryptococcus wingfieldii CBS 7118]|uniref:DNA-(apurinic or apyrimidinic site) endonuclease n=1 Tax=Cryptococcus wingfieldii CBS 7118 TaxID=1295528 RepID=A0A1E3J1I8_9TREE|nr:exodeoxyribonuclease III [Cryptococcus wingfieldii CBS 7118]ODN94694.1 exodeoxyribonuclease III [Cryptococcus wingfieldii CBS 7118]